MFLALSLFLVIANASGENSGASQTVSESEGTFPKLTRKLVLNIPDATNPYFQITDYWKEAIAGRPLPIGEGQRIGTAVWEPAEIDSENVIRSRTGAGPLYVEWEESKERKVLLNQKSWRFLFNGDMETGAQLIPVTLRKGVNSIMTWNWINFRLYPVKAPIILDAPTTILPDPTSGEKGPFQGSVVAINCSDLAQRIHLKAQVDDGPVTETQTDRVPAMDRRIVRFHFNVAPQISVGAHKLKLWVYKESVATADIHVPAPGMPYRRTFVSRFDGMIHGYALLPSRTKGLGQPLALFTYGGGAIGSDKVIQNFQPKDWCSIVVPEFRTFDWIGLARRDALETLDNAAKLLRADRRRLYLIGHSFGGHGAYNIASLNPDAFAGIGVSAGWVSLFTYLPKEFQRLNRTDPITAVFAAAQEEMDVDKRLDELSQIKNVVLVHGDKDHAVPISESYRVKEELTKRGAEVHLFVRPGADHFWQLPDGSGNQYDFPPMFDIFRTSPHRGSGAIWTASKAPRTWADAMGNRGVAVYGTHGTPEETRIAEAGARAMAAFACLIFQVDCEVAPDTIDASRLKGRNVFLFGTPTSNALWKFHPTAPHLLHLAHEKRLAVTAWLIQGRKGEDIWSAIGGYELSGCRLAYYLQPWFSSNYPFPEWILMDQSVLDRDFSGVLAAGFNGGVEGWRAR
jgi:dienelactone hydrolase